MTTLALETGFNYVTDYLGTFVEVSNFSDVVLLAVLLFVHSSLDILQLSILPHQWVHAGSNLLVLWRVFSNLRINKEDINSAQVQHSRIP